MRRLLAFFALAMALVAYKRVEAQDLPASYWVHVGGVSAHSVPDREGFNPGLGIEARWSDTWAASAGVMHNSQDRTSRYAMAQYTPLQADLPAVGRVFAGVALVGMDGYRYRDGRPFVFPAPLIERRFERAAVAVMYTPKVDGVTEGHTVAVLFKVRTW